MANYHFCRHADPYWLSTISELLLLPIELSEVPSDARGFVLRVVEAFRAGRPLDVIEELRVNPLANPKSPHMSAPLAALVARVYAQQEDYGRAALLLQRAHALRPSDGRVAYDVGVIYLRLRQHAKAVEFFELSVALDPSLGQAWAALTVIYALERRHGETERAARHALRLCQPPHILSDIALTQATYALHKPVEGRIDFTSLAADGAAFCNEWLRHFPATEPASLAHPGHGRPITFIYADHHYMLAHAIPLVLSLRDVGTESAIHLHVANPGSGLTNALDQLAAAVAPLPVVVSSEHIDATKLGHPAVYHSCMRFVRLAQLAIANDATVTMLDADSLARQNPDILENFCDPAADIVLTRSWDDPFWAGVRACLITARPTPAARLYLTQVAAFILDNLRQRHGRWFLDQVALAACADLLENRVCFGQFPMDLFGDRNFTSEQVFWNAVNSDKTADNAYTRRKAGYRAIFGQGNAG